jgi:hypothetical protein
LLLGEEALLQSLAFDAKYKGKGRSSHKRKTNSRKGSSLQGFMPSLGNQESFLPRMLIEASRPYVFKKK